MGEKEIKYVSKEDRKKMAEEPFYLFRS